MNTPLTTAEIVERVKARVAAYTAVLERNRDGGKVSASLLESARNELSDALAALLALERERDASQRSHEHTKYWYSVRLERLKDLGKEHGIWPAMASIIANGTADPAEPPTYAQAFNRMLHRAEAAEAELAKVQETEPSEAMIDAALKGWYGVDYNQGRMPPPVLEYHREKAITCCRAVLRARAALSGSTV